MRYVMIEKWQEVKNRQAICGVDEWVTLRDACEKATQFLAAKKWVVWLEQEAIHRWVTETVRKEAIQKGDIAITFYAKMQSSGLKGIKCEFLTPSQTMKLRKLAVSPPEYAVCAINGEERG